MDATNVIDPAPDWSTRKDELHCPLCGYNLRGLDQPRCPECGFAFTWAELIRGQGEKHPYLFEHQNKRNLWSFWETYRTDCRPRDFWRDLSPAFPVQVRRLILFWMISYLPIAIALLTPVVINVSDVFYGANIGHWFTARSASFFDRLLEAIWHCGEDHGHVTLICSAMLVLGWPWMTLAFLMVFVQSMRQAKINRRHVLRAVIYGSDCSLLALALVIPAWNAHYKSGYPVGIALVCFGVTLYRTSIAYRKYLRFHLPFVTVLTSQLIVLMVVIIVYVNGLFSFH